MDQRLIVGGDGRQVFVAGSQQAVLVLGPPRSGKTSGIVVPNVMAAPGPVVSTSTKPDVLDATAWRRARQGRCWLYDPTGTVTPPPGVTPLRWSPVSGASTWDGALLMARAMVRARPSPGPVDHWTERAEALLGPLLHAAAVSGAPMDDVVRWVNRREGKPAVAALRDAGGVPLDVLAGILATDVRELSGIWSTASSVVGAYRSSGALASAASPNFDPAAFVAGSDTVYVCAAGRSQDLVAPLVVGLLEDVRAAAFAAAARTAARPAAPVVFALDEVANIAPIPDLPGLVSEGGSQGVLTLACLQDLSQARMRWGQAADGFGSLFGATVVLPGIGDVRTLEALSVLCGTHEVRAPAGGRSASWPTGRHSTSQSWSTRRERRVEPAAIAQGRPGCSLVVGGGRPPGWTPVTPWWRVPAWTPPEWGRLRSPSLGRGRI